MKNWVLKPSGAPPEVLILDPNTQLKEPNSISKMSFFQKYYFSENLKNLKNLKNIEKYAFLAHLDPKFLIFSKF